LGLFRHNVAENGPHDLKMVLKAAASNSTHSVIKISPYTARAPPAAAPWPQSYKLDLSIATGVFFFSGAFLLCHNRRKNDPQDRGRGMDVGI
jgi:hypothetical protein